MFRSKNAQAILSSIKRNIYTAIAKRQRRTSQSHSIRNRTVSSSQSEKRFRALLERSRSTLGSRCEEDEPLSGSDTTSTPPMSPTDVNPCVEYNRLTLRKSSSNMSMEKPNIVAAITVKDEMTGNESQVLFDDNGYAHLPAPSVSEDKSIPVPLWTDSVRSTSTSSRDSVSEDKSISVPPWTDSVRSTSSSSKDSGVLSTSFDPKNSATEKDVEESSSDNKTYIDIPASAVEKVQVYLEEYTFRGDPDKLLNDGNLTVEAKDTLRALPTVPVNSIPEARRKDSPAHIYSDIDNLKSFHQIRGIANDNAATPRRCSDGDVKKAENQYEELDKFRKNLTKHLGIDPAIKKPMDVPPALPARPTSLQLRRKKNHNKTKSKGKHLLPFKLTHTRSVSMSSSSSSASEADDESESRRHTISNIQNWLLPTSKYNRSQLYPMIEFDVTNGNTEESFRRPRCSSEVTIPSSGKTGPSPAESDCVYTLPMKVEIANQHATDRLLFHDSDNIAPAIPPKQEICTETHLEPLIDIDPTPYQSSPKTVVYDVKDDIGQFKIVDESSLDKFDPLAPVLNPFPSIGDFRTSLEGMTDDTSDTPTDQCTNIPHDVPLDGKSSRNEMDILFGGNPWAGCDNGIESARKDAMLLEDNSIFDPFGFFPPFVGHGGHAKSEALYVDMSVENGDDCKDSECAEYVKPSDILLE